MPSPTSWENSRRNINMKRSTSRSVDGMLKYSSCGGRREKMEVLSFLVVLLFSTEFMIQPSNAAMTLSPSMNSLNKMVNYQPSIYSGTHPQMQREIRSGNSKFNSDSQYNRLSRALEKIHFGRFIPLFRLRSGISSRGAPSKHGSSSTRSAAASFVGDGYSARRRVNFPHSGESFPAGRGFSRPTIMRLRWG